MHLPKKGLRACGIAESYRGRRFSTLAAVVMRKDRIIDGFAFGRVRVGGNDATDEVIRMVRDLGRRDINAIFLSGCVIAWFNVLDPDRIHDETGFPVVCITYEDSEGLEADIRHHFPGDEDRISAYLRLGTRTPVILPCGLTIFLRSWGMGEKEAGILVQSFIADGKIPEPLRVARICSRSAGQFFQELQPEYRDPQDKSSNTNEKKY